MARLRALEEEWADEPPTHLLMQLVAKFIGWKPKRRPKKRRGPKRKIDEKGVRELMSMFPTGKIQ